MVARIVVVGLGPGGADWVVPRARRTLAEASARFVRTARHQAVADLAADGLDFESFDARYEAADDLDSVYPAIVDALVAAAREHGDVAYAVPGSAVVAERSVELLRARADAGEVELELVPGVSFAELAWARVGVDPLHGARVVDGRDLDGAVLDVGGPVLIAQVDSRLVCSDVKLALLERLDPGTPVTVLEHLGLEDERVTTLALAELDRAVEPDHLTAVFVELPPGASDAFGALVALGRRLRGPGGCPWDAEQTHRSLTRYLLEEAYEVVDAIELLGDDDASPDPGGAAYAAVADELGDLLFQVVFHSLLAEEAHAFSTADVSRGIHDKLVRRHPHVFGDVAVESASDVVRNWEQIKKEERSSESLVDAVPTGLPALLFTLKLFRKAASIGLEPADRDVAARAITDAVARSAGPEWPGDADGIVGEVLGAAVMLARSAGIDPESALRGWAGRYRAHFQEMEAVARERGLDLHALDPSAVASLWAETGVAQP